MISNSKPIRLEKGDPLPNWSLESIFGETVPKISDLNNKPLLLVFFSLGCPGCFGRAIPFANRVVYERGEFINVIGIHTDFHSTGYTLSQFNKAKNEFFIRFPFFRDIDYDKTFRDYGAGGTPHWILVDTDGYIQYSIFGSDPNNALLKLDYKLAELLGKR